MTLSNRLPGLLLFAVLLALAPAAFAVDGVVLINQNTSLSGIPGCPHAGLPIVICQSGSYRLTGNLTIPDVNTDGIDIKADNVTLDLNGFAMSGPVKCTPATYPVQCTATGTGTGVATPNGQNNITLLNGTVQGMGAGGVHISGNGLRIERLHVSSNAGANGAGIYMQGLGLVTHCTVTVNAGAGILGTGVVTVSFNTVSYNGGDGIARAGVATSNTVFANGQTGISLAGLASNNTVINNIGFGIATHPGGGDAFTGNVISGNGAPTNGGTSLGNNLCDGVVC